MSKLHHELATSTSIVPGNNNMAMSKEEAVLTLNSEPELHFSVKTSLCENVTFLPYLSPTFQDDGEVDPLWEETVQQLDSDLHWLLKLPHSNFWSQMVFDSSLQKSLDSYLRHAPRSYDRPLNLPLKIKEIQRNVHKRVFMTFLRASTSKESEANRFSPTIHAELIYKYYLFDLPKLLDLCVLYASSNKPILAKMVANVFKVQPKYAEDWSLAVLSFAKILKKVSDKILPTQEAVLLTDPPKSLPAEEVTDVILYLSDTSSTIKAFLDVYPPAVRSLVKGGFLETFVNFFDSVVPVLQTEWLKARRIVADAPYIKDRFRQFKRDSVWIVDSILHVYFDPNIGEDDQSQISLDGFIAAVTLVFTEKNFFHEFKKHYSLISLIHEMQQLHPELPDSHFDYIVSSLDEPSVREKPRAEAPVDKLSGLVSQVKELLPHLGEGFIELCLKEFGNNPETVVDRVLEGNLPAHLKEVKQSVTKDDLRKRSSQTKAENPRLPGKGSTSKKTGPLEERANVFDNDEFDVFNEDVTVDLSRVHFGKRLNPTSALTVLNDKAHLSETRQMYRQYEVEAAWTHQQPGEEEGPSLGLREIDYEFNQYSDEYDDTYDSHAVGAADNDSSEELFTVRRLNDKGQYSQHYSQFPDTEDDSGDPASDASHVTVTSSHVTVLQPPHEQKERFTSKPKTSSQSPRKPTASKGQGSKSHSTEGKPVESERARHLKEKNKAKRANHNRKAMADKKRSKGMGALPRQ